MDKNLPTKPSALLELALGDLRLCEQNPDFHIDMETWYDDRLKECCCVCLGGAVIAQRLPVPECDFINGDLLPFPDDIRGQLRALNAFRLGKVSAAFVFLDRPRPSQLPPEIAVVPYGEDPGMWWTQMLELVNLLKDAGA